MNVNTYIVTVAAYIVDGTSNGAAVSVVTLAFSVDPEAGSAVENPYVFFDFSFLCVCKINILNAEILC